MFKAIIAILAMALLSGCQAVAVKDQFLGASAEVSAQKADALCLTAPEVRTARVKAVNSRTTKARLVLFCK